MTSNYLFVKFENKAGFKNVRSFLEVTSSDEHDVFQSVCFETEDKAKEEMKSLIESGL